MSEFGAYIKFWKFILVVRLIPNIRKFMRLRLNIWKYMRFMPRIRKFKPRNEVWAA